MSAYNLQMSADMYVMQNYILVSFIIFEALQMTGMLIKLHLIDIHFTCTTATN